MHAWSATATVAAAMLIATEAGCAPFALGAAAGSRVVGHDFADHVRSGDGGKVEPDPTDDGFIIVECVAYRGYHGDHGPFGENAHREFVKACRSDLRFVAIPRLPLGPSECHPPSKAAGYGEGA
jgi:hypothetical protein